jgi:hypothetical protein
MSPSRNGVAANGASDNRDAFESVFLARVERNSSDAAQPNKLVTLILEHRNVFPVTCELMSLFKPDRFHKAFDSECS